MWRVAFVGYKHAAGSSGNSATLFEGLPDFNPGDWTGIRTSCEPVTVHEGDVLYLLHLQTQLCAGVCPVVTSKELEKDHACLLANARGCLLKLINMSGCLHMEELRGFIREALREFSGTKDLLIVVAGLAAIDNSVRACSTLCRLEEEARPRRLSVVLCVQGADQ